MRWRPPVGELLMGGVALRSAGFGGGRQPLLCSRALRVRPFAQAEMSDEMARGTPAMHGLELAISRQLSTKLVRDPPIKGQAAGLLPHHVCHLHVLRLCCWFQLPSL